MKNYSKAYKTLNKINLGWNLGNYLDSHDKTYKLGESSNHSVEQIVNLWHNPTFNLKCLETLTSYTINTIRIPVTWSNFIHFEKNNISISNEIFEHLKKIINQAIKLEMLIILDMHHDDQTWLTVACSKKEFKQIKNQYSQIWQRVAEEFKDYPENLIFEGMNEIIDRSQEKPDWWGHNNIFFKRLYSLYKLFTKSVRKFSENNKKRTLMISTYGAQIHNHALKHFKMIKDKNVIVDVHYYTKHNEIEHFEKNFMPIFENLISKNIPIILGEIGTKKDFIDDFSILKTYLDFAKFHNIKCVLWDNGSSRSFINRQTAEFIHKEMQNYLNQNK